MTAPMSEQLDGVRTGWQISPFTLLLLREASAWFEQLRGRRLPVTSGGPWQLWSPEIAALRSLPSVWLTTIGA